MRNRRLFERQKENVCLFNEEAKVKKILDFRLFVFLLVSLTQSVPASRDRALFCFSLAQKPSVFPWGPRYTLSIKFRQATLKANEMVVWDKAPQWRKKAKTGSFFSFLLQGGAWSQATEMTRNDSKDELKLQLWQREEQIKSKTATRTWHSSRF